MRLRPFGLAVGLVVVILAGSAPAPASPAGSPGRDGGTVLLAGADRFAISPLAHVAYRAPVTPLTVMRAFDHGVTRYGAGHRGVDLSLEQGGTVRAAAAGVVTFAGPVAGVSVVVVRHADGIRTTYEPVVPAVSAGAAVVAGQVIGRLGGVHPGCAAGCLHWGARRGDEYLDPLELLRPLGPVRLIPWA